jgi:peptidoglycan/LPS O-acetylase OafA/YrhL
MEEPKTDRLPALDLLRGLAALAIVTRHFPWPGDVVGFLPRDYLAVDLFFVLSGFVLARAYWPELSQRRGQASFAIARVVRLGPLYLLATVFAAAIGLANGNPPGAWAATLGLNLLFLPGPSLAGLSPNLFPFVFPSWSLFWELIANFVLALIAFRLRGPLLTAIVLLGAVALAVTAHQVGSLNAGVRWSTLLGGGSRVLFGFFAGVGVFFVRGRLRVRIAVPDWLLGLVLLAAFVPAPSLAFGEAYDFFIALLLFPLLVLLGADARTTPPSARIGIGLGGISYGAYVLHQPLAQFAEMFVSHERLGGSGIAGCAGFVIVVMVAAWVATRWFDTPVRRWIGRRLRAQRARDIPSFTTTSPVVP